VLLLCLESDHIYVIPEEGMGHIPSVTMINHLIWFFQIAVNKERDLGCHCALGSSFFVQGIITLRKPIILVGNTRWEQTTEHCRSFLVITMQLLHEVRAIVLWWIMMGPQTCIGTCSKNEHDIISPTNTTTMDRN
jgi:hypothetical protein